MLPVREEELDASREAKLALYLMVQHYCIRRIPLCASLVSTLSNYIVTRVRSYISSCLSQNGTLCCRFDHSLVSTALYLLGFAWEIALFIF